MSFDEKSQTILVSSRKKGEHLLYEVQKEGVVQLRKYKNKKFRVVFNVLPLKNLSEKLVTKFNHHMFDSNAEDKSITQNESNQLSTLSTQQKKEALNPYSFLAISTKSKQLSDNRIIITLNAYIHEEDPHNLVVLGYLISSLVLYHNWNSEFSQQSTLTSLLSLLGKLLKKTHIDQLNQEIKFKTGYEKSPYFLCLIGNQPKNDNSEIKTQNLAEDNLTQAKHHQNYLNNFYRFQSQKQHSQINSALETLIDYFPQRSSLAIELQSNKSVIDFTERGLTQIQELGKQFEHKLLGRQLFSFEFTSTTVQNLLFQLCQCFNTQKNINLAEIYNKVILNKKSRIQTETIEEYLGLIRKLIFKGNKVDLDDAGMGEFGKDMQGSSIMPVSDLQLGKKLANIQELILNQMQSQALNCMSLQEYLQAKDKVLRRIRIYELKLQSINHQLGIKFLEQCHEILDIERQQLAIDWNQPHSSTIVSQLFNFLIGKLSSFSNECIGLFTEGDSNGQKYNQTFLQLAASYFAKLQKMFSSTVEEFHLAQRKSLLQIETLNFQLKKFFAQKQAIQKEYQLQLLLEADLKSKFKEHILEQSFCSTYSSESTILKKTDSLTMGKKIESSTFNSSKQYYRMKKIIEQLEEQVKDKNNQIQQLTEILDKFEATLKSTNTLAFYEKKNDKFNEQTQMLIAQANSKILKFYQILEEVKNIEKHYENAKKSLLKERQKIIDQKKESLKEISSLKDTNEQIKLENEKLMEVIQQEKKALQKFTQLKDTLKLNINQLEADHAETTCALAEVEGELEFYRKALSLVVEQYLKGKSENLTKFYKFLEHPKLKQLLKPLIKH